MREWEKAVSARKWRERQRRAAASSDLHGEGSLQWAGLRFVAKAQPKLDAAKARGDQAEMAYWDDVLDRCFRDYMRRAGYPVTDEEVSRRRAEALTTWRARAIARATTGATTGD